MEIPQVWGDSALCHWSLTPARLHSCAPASLEEQNRLGRSEIEGPQVSSGISLSLSHTFSVSLHLSESLSQRKLSCECMFLGSLSHHNKDLERRILKPSARHSSRVLDKPCYSSQANQCYSSILFIRQQENPSLKRESMPTQRLEEKRVEERAGEGERGRERERAHTRGREREPQRKRFGSSFYMFFSSTQACL